MSYYKAMLPEKQQAYRDKQKAYRLKNKDKVKEYKQREMEKFRAERREFGLSWNKNRKWMKLLWAAQVEWSND